MAIAIAQDTFVVVVGGADVWIRRGDIYDTTHAAYTAAGASHFVTAPTGLTTFHKVSGMGESGGS